MSDQHPGVEDEVERALRLGLATASQIADRYARARQDVARQSQYRSEQEGRQLEARYRAEGAAATARLALVHRTEWWDRAAPPDITSMWQLAVQWQNEQPRAATAARTIARQVHDRYGLDVNAPGVGTEAFHAAVARLDAEQHDRSIRPSDRDVAAAVAAVARAEQRDAALVSPAVEQQQMGAMREQQGADRAALLELEAEQYVRDSADGDTTTLAPKDLSVLSAATRVPASVDRSDAAPLSARTATDSVPPWDSIERREQTAHVLREAGLSADAVAVAMRADVAHSQPANEAVTTRPTSHGSNRKAVARVTERSDRSR